MCKYLNDYFQIVLQVTNTFNSYNNRHIIYVASDVCLVCQLANI